MADDSGYRREFRQITTPCSAMCGGPVSPRYFRSAVQNASTSMACSFRRSIKWDFNPGVFKFYLSPFRFKMPPYTGHGREGYAIIPFAYRLSGPNTLSIPFFIVSPTLLPKKELKNAK